MNNIEEKLLNLGFKTLDNVNFVKNTRGRFTYEFRVNTNDGSLEIIGCFSTRYKEVSVAEVLANHNNLHTEAKNLMLELQELGLN